MKKILFLLLTMVCLSASAQLRKAANIEKVKSFTNGSVVLNKTTTDSVAIYSVTLRNNSRLHENIVFFLGNKEDMLKNLKDLSQHWKVVRKVMCLSFLQLVMIIFCHTTRFWGRFVSKCRNPIIHQVTLEGYIKRLSMI